MIELIIYCVVVVIISIPFCVWNNRLNKKGKEIKRSKESLYDGWAHYQTGMAELNAKLKAANKKQKDADDAWQKCLAEGNRLMEKQHELEAREAEIEGKEARLKQVNTAEVPDIIEPVEEPARPVKKARKGGKK